MSTFDKVVAGVIAIGLVTAFGLHATQLAPLTKQIGSSSSGILHTAETGNA
jgi:hypothetical protein